MSFLVAAARFSLLIRSVRFAHPFPLLAVPARLHVSIAFSLPVGLFTCPSSAFVLPVVSFLVAAARFPLPIISARLANYFPLPAVPARLPVSIAVACLTCPWIRFFHLFFFSCPSPDFVCFSSLFFSYSLPVWLSIYSDKLARARPLSLLFLPVVSFPYGCSSYCSIQTVFLPYPTSVCICFARCLFSQFFPATTVSLSYLPSYPSIAFARRPCPASHVHCLCLFDLPVVSVCIFPLPVIWLGLFCPILFFPVLVCSLSLSVFHFASFRLPVPYSTRLRRPSYPSSIFLSGFPVILDCPILDFFSGTFFCCRCPFSFTN